MIYLFDICEGVFNEASDNKKNDYFHIIPAVSNNSVVLFTMGLDVAHMAKEGSNSKCTECILCGACVDECPKKVLKYCWRWK